jgi:hypothetical protein
MGLLVDVMGPNNNRDDIIKELVFSYVEVT